MSEAPATVPLPSGFAPLAAQLHQQLGDTLAALLMFGSCLSEHTRQPDSVPDLLAFVGNLGTALQRLGAGPLTRALAGWLPPLTLALHDLTPDSDGAPLAKLNLIELLQAHKAVHELPDLYLAGRLSKPTAWLWSRDRESRAAVESLLHDAAVAVADLTLRGLDGQAGPIDLEAVVLGYIGQSYLAEVRPEGAEKWRALHASFPDFYAQRVRPLILTRAPLHGLHPQLAHVAQPLEPGDPLPTNQGPTLRDERTPAQRQADHQIRAQLLRRSRLRMLARWPKMALVYRGWFPYLVRKLQRVWRQRRAAGPRRDDPSG